MLRAEETVMGTLGGGDGINLNPNVCQQFI
jgi:hypothetical protein